MDRFFLNSFAVDIPRSGIARSIYLLRNCQTVLQSVIELKKKIMEAEHSIYTDKCKIVNVQLKVFPQTEQSHVTSSQKSRSRVLPALQSPPQGEPLFFPVIAQIHVPFWI